MFIGSFVALVTPMHPDGSIDYPAYEKLLQWHVSSKTDGLVILGTTAECPTIQPDERLRLIETAIAQVGGKKPVIVGTGTNCTQTTISLTQQAAACGADGALLITPYYNKPTQAGLKAHYAAVAEAVDIPLILYNCPSRTGCDLLPETVAELADYKHIVAIKEASGDSARYSQLASYVALISGNDDETLNMMRVGATGVISVAANVVPDQMHQLCAWTQAGELHKAEQLDTWLQPLFHALFTETNPIPTKYALQVLGFIQQGIRLPLTWLSEAHQIELRALLNREEFSCVNA